MRISSAVSCRALLWLVPLMLCGLGCANRVETWQDKQNRETQQYMDETLAKARTIPATAEGVRELSWLYYRAYLKVGALHSVGPGGRFWAEMDKLRHQQLNDARDAVIAAAHAEVKAGRVPPPKEWFLTVPDLDHPTYKAVEQIKRQELARRQAVQDQETAEARRELGQTLIEGAKLFAEARERRRNTLIAQGLCPDCEGKGTYTQVQDEFCRACGGSGQPAGSYYACNSCGGSGKKYYSSTTRECRSCDGTGKYAP